MLCTLPRASFRHRIGFRGARQSKFVEEKRKRRKKSQSEAQRAMVRMCASMVNRYLASIHGLRVGAHLVGIPQRHFLRRAVEGRRSYLLSIRDHINER